MTPEDVCHDDKKVYQHNTSIPIYQQLSVENIEKNIHEWMVSKGRFDNFLEKEIIRESTSKGRFCYSSSRGWIIFSSEGPHFRLVRSNV